MEVYIKSDIGQKRPLNEDRAGYFINQTQQPLFIVCDGVGGHQAGEVASQMAIDLIGRSWEETAFLEPTEMTEWLKENIEKNNAAIYKQGQENFSLKGMATTLVAAALLGDTLVVLNVGDSRAYLYRNGATNQITEDHSLVNELVKQGELTPQEAEHHPQKNVITRSLGLEYNVQVADISLKVKAEDIVLLCSDGLSDIVPLDKINDILNDEKTLDEASSALIDLANNAGGFDNITVLLASDLQNGQVKSL